MSIPDPSGSVKETCGGFARPVCPETLMLAALCLLDLLTTLHWLSTGQMTEGNWMMAPVLVHGPRGLILAKLLLFVPALAAAEWYRPRSPERIRRVLRMVLTAYAVVYFAGAGPRLLAEAAVLING